MVCIQNNESMLRLKIDEIMKSSLTTIGEEICSMTISKINNLFAVCLERKPYGGSKFNCLVETF